jgi:hypothetical protein
LQLRQKFPFLLAITVIPVVAVALADDVGELAEQHVVGWQLGGTLPE